MAPGRAGLTVYEYPSRLIGLTSSSCLQQTGMLCVQYLSGFWWKLPTQTLVYLQRRPVKSHRSTTPCFVIHFLICFYSPVNIGCPLKSELLSIGHV